MSVVNVLKQSKKYEALNSLVMFLNLLKYENKTLSLDQSAQLNKIIEQLNINPQPKKVAKILSHFCQKITDYPVQSRETNYAQVLYEIFYHVDIDFNHYTKTSPLLIVLIKAIDILNLEQEKNVALHILLLKKSNKQVNFNQITIDWDQQKAPIIYHYLNNDQYPAILNHILEHHKNYQLDFTQNNTLFLRYIVANYHHGERLQNKLNMFKYLDESILTHEFTIEKEKNRKIQLFNRVLVNSSYSFIQHMIKRYPNLVAKAAIESSDILNNSFLDFEEKIKFLQHFKLTKLGNYHLYRSILISAERDEEKIEKFLDYCNTHFSIVDELGETLNHLICDYSQFNNPAFLEKFILPLKLKHCPNFENNFPLHTLLNNSNYYEINRATLRLLNHFKEQNVDFHTLDKNNNNALHLALSTKKDQEVITFLIKEGVSLATKNKEGNTAYSFLIKNKEAYAPLLEEATSYYEKETLNQTLSSCVSSKKHKI